MRINTNIAANNTQRQRSINSGKTAKAINKLSSGKRINSAADDAAGLAISEKMRAQIRGMDMASKNCQDAISLIQTADGGLQTTQDMLQRMRELAVQSGSDTNENGLDRKALDEEYQQLLKEVNVNASSTQFNGISLLDGSLSGKTAVITADVEARINSYSNLTYPGVLFTSASFVQGDLSGFTSISFSYGVRAGTNVPANDFLHMRGTNEDSTITDFDYIFPSEHTTGGGTAHKTGDIITIDFGRGTVLTFTIGPAGDNIPYGTPSSLSRELVLALGTIPVKQRDSSGLIIQSGPNYGDTTEINIERMDGIGLGIDPSDVASRAGASNAILRINSAINSVSSQRGDIGAIYNRLEFKTAGLDGSSENLQAAESRIRDLDMAKGMGDLTKSNILSQASTAMLAQANALPQGVLQLIGV